MSSQEFGRWAAYWAEEPPDMRGALPQLLAMVARAGGLQMANGDTPAPHHFAVRPWVERAPDDAAAQIVALFGGG